MGLSGDYNYQSPEMTRKQHYNQATDVWSASLIAFQLISNGRKKLELYLERDLETLEKDVDLEISKLECEEEEKEFLKLIIQP